MQEKAKMSDDLFAEEERVFEEGDVADDTITPLEGDTDTTAQETEVVDDIKERRKLLTKGEDELIEVDFILNGELQEKDWKAYSKAVEGERAHATKMAKLVFDNDDDFQEEIDQQVERQLKDFLKLLHKKGSKFNTYLPVPAGKKKAKAKKAQKSGIPELDRYRELCRNVNKAFTDWRNANQEYTEVTNYISETLGITSDSTYLKGEDNPIKVLDEFKGFEPYWRFNGAVENYIKQNFEASDTVVIESDDNV
jgi:hypothetical protein